MSENAGTGRLILMDKLFKSYDKPIPPLRYDVQRIPLTQNGHSLIYFYDSMGYATTEFAIPSDAEAILSLIDGIRSVEEIMKFSSDDVTKEQILGYVRFLDEHGLLDSEHFKEHSELIESEYERSEYHRCTTSGVSYPADPDELNEFLTRAFKENEQTDPVTSARALYAPHIDPRVGMNNYVKAFSSIRELKPKRVVILATSHYSGLYGKMYEDSPFIISDKTFSMPNGDLSAGIALQQILKQAGDDESNKYGVSVQTRAHRVEHSIELHLLFLNHIWKHDFEIVPVLVGGMDELMYSRNSHKEEQLDNFSFLLRNELDDPDTFYLISGDLSHFGKKFGDPRPATKMAPEVQKNDERFLDIGSKADPDKLIRLMSEEYDPYRICGFPPLLTFLKTFPGLKGEILSYDLWDEHERESAVSFGSILYQ